MTIRLAGSKARRAQHRSRAALDCFSCPARGESEWCEIDDAGMRLLNQAKTCHTYQPGDVVFRQGQPCAGIYVIESGTIALRRGDSWGNSVLVRLVHAGESLGTRAFFAGSGYEATAEALHESRICFVPQQATRELLRLNPSVAMRFLASMARQLQEAEDARLQGVALSVRARLVTLLLRLCERFARVEDHGATTITLPVSRQDLSEMVGTRPETIARVIRALTDDGVAFFEGRVVRVPDLEALRNEVEDPAAR